MVRLEVERFSPGLSAHGPLASASANQAKDRYRPKISLLQSNLGGNSTVAADRGRGQSRQASRLFAIFGLEFGWRAEMVTSGLCAHWLSTLIEEQSRLRRLQTEEDA